MPADVSLPPVPGDPAGMRALAAALRNDASLLAVIAAETASTVESLEFFGPAATRLDGRAGQSGWMMSGTAADQSAYGPEFVGGAGQHLLFSLSSDTLIWTGPVPWERVRDLQFAAAGAGRAVVVSAAGSAIAHAGAALGGAG